MDLTYEQQDQQLEAEHWWFTDRCATVRKLISRLHVLPEHFEDEARAGRAWSRVLRRAGRLRPRTSHWLNGQLGRLLKAENTILQHLPLPVGVSVFAIVRKP